MIKIALKHWVYEICIDQLFSSISKNFSKVNINSFNLREGHRYAVINVRLVDLRDGKELKMDFYNCKIIDVKYGNDPYTIFSSQYLREYDNNGNYIGSQTLTGGTSGVFLSDIIGVSSRKL